MAIRVISKQSYMLASTLSNFTDSSLYFHSQAASQAAVQNIAMNWRGNLNYWYLYKTALSMKHCISH